MEPDHSWRACCYVGGIEMHCYLVTDDCASMGRRRVELDREKGQPRQLEARHSSCAYSKITEKAHSNQCNF